MPRSDESREFGETRPKCLKIAGLNNADNANPASVVLSCLGRMKLFHGLMSFEQYKARPAPVTQGSALIWESRW